MKYILLMFMLFSLNSQAETMCDVRICNKISRFSIDPWSHMKDHFGKVCFNIQMPQSEAVIGKVLDSESRWYQGSSINPTKKSVTTIDSIGTCK